MSSLTHEQSCHNYLQMKQDRIFPLALVSVALLATSLATAQNFTTLYSFTNSGDGYDPQSTLILSNNILYGTTVFGGISNSGTLFKVNTDGTGFTNIHSFTAASVSGPLDLTNSDGVNPTAGVILSGSTLYGTTTYGGISGFGTVFKVNTDGTDFRTLHSFSGINDGSLPHAGLVLSGNILYGTARSGGGLGWGTVFAVNTDGTGFTNLHSFALEDGIRPQSSLLLSGNTLYGTASAGGNVVTNNVSNGGSIFAVNTDGTGFTNLYSFTGGNDGNNPQAVLILFSNTLYGTVLQGGTAVRGSIFAVNTNGTGFTNLYSFTGGIDGMNPSSLIMSGNAFYGTTSQGGSSGNGTLFAINIDGSEFTNLYSFSAGTGSLPKITNSDGALPGAGLILSGNTLYGTAATGGSISVGTVFSLSFPPPQLSISPLAFDTNFVLKWASGVAGYSYSGYTLQSTTNLVSTSAWTNVSAPPVVISGQNTVTNLVSGTQMFFRLSH